MNQIEMSHGSTSKIDRYSWVLKDRPGDLLSISKHELFVDESYQRHANEKRVLALARAWSWVACGAIVVGERDGRWWVIDGQHRVLGARRRSDIDKLPCIVFQTSGATEEANGFLNTNVNRRPMYTFEKFKALLKSEQPDAMLASQLIASARRQPATSTGHDTVSCLSTLMNACKNSRDCIVRLWPMISVLCEGKGIPEKLIQGLIYLEERMPEGESLSDKKWAQRLSAVGSETLVQSAQKSAAYYSRGGAKVYADGMLQAINKGLRNRLEIEGMSKAP
jgi:hypothetical protein